MSSVILGIDEVGRGAWAGPMVVGAAVLGDVKIEGLTDSKKLTKRMRERLAIEIKQKARGVGLGWVSARTIDDIGLSAALKLAARRAVANVGCDYDEIIIDGTIRLIEGDNIILLKKADLLIPAVSAAAIVAKVARDAYMTYLDDLFEGYGFSGHVGYGTAAHMKALEEHGVLPLHRKSFAPIAALLNAGNAPASPASVKAATGAIAETTAAAYLESLGHVILTRNWKTPRCEIDIVSEFALELFFTEVKYRKQPNQGGGLAAITPEKLRRMKYAAETFVTKYNRASQARRLSAISLTGEPPQIETYLETLGT